MKDSPLFLRRRLQSGPTPARLGAGVLALTGGGERGKLAFADIAVSIPPDQTREIGQVQWPKELPGNPETDFVASKAQDITGAQALTWTHQALTGVPKRRVLVFVHGFNNKFEEAVFRYAQIIHDFGGRRSCRYFSLGRRAAACSPMAMTTRVPATPATLLKAFFPLGGADVQRGGFHCPSREFSRKIGSCHVSFERQHSSIEPPSTSAPSAQLAGRRQRSASSTRRRSSG